MTGSANAQDFRPCQYQGSAHLCFTQVNQQNGYGIGEAIIADSNYKVVATVNTAGNVQPADMHEFQLLNDGETAIISAYQVIPYDLSSFNITSGLGWLLEGVFQEINVTTGELIFEWFSSNHVEPSDTQIAPNGTDTGGDGFTPATAFDYFHINAIDKTPSGNYLVSARDTSAIYYINGTDRSVSWTLSYQGRSDFICTNFNFSYQHDVRLQSENETTTVISIFDDASNGYTTTSPQSAGKYISIDHNSGNATLINEIFFPNGGILTTSQGNTQTLDNGGAFIGWGDNPYFSEHSANGSVVLLANWGVSGTAMSYRSFTSAWESTPASTIPAVYSYAKSTNSSNQIYISWNGATTVANWRIYGAQGVGDDFKVLGITSKMGFETFWESSSFYQWVRVEALGTNGTSLRNSSYTSTFVPSEALASACTDSGCATASTYST